MSDIVKRLRETIVANDVWYQGRPKTSDTLLERFICERKEAAEEIEKLRAALQPFADAADDFIAEKHDMTRAIVSLGDLRAAAAALKETTDR